MTILLLLCSHGSAGKKKKNGNFSTETTNLKINFATLFAFCSNWIVIFNNKKKKVSNLFEWTCLFQVKQWSELIIELMLVKAIRVTNKTSLRIRCNFLCIKKSSLNVGSWATNRRLLWKFIITLYSIFKQFFFSLSVSLHCGIIGQTFSVDRIANVECTNTVLVWYHDVWLLLLLLKMIENYLPHAKIPF